MFEVQPGSGQKEAGGKCVRVQVEVLKVISTMPPLSQNEWQSPILETFLVLTSESVAYTKLRLSETYIHFFWKENLSTNRSQQPSARKPVTRSTAKKRPCMEAFIHADPCCSCQQCCVHARLRRAGSPSREGHPSM